MKMNDKSSYAKVEDLVEQLGTRTQVFQGQVFENLAINMSESKCMKMASCMF